MITKGDTYTSHYDSAITPGRTCTITITVTHTGRQTIIYELIQHWSDREPSRTTNQVSRKTFQERINGLEKQS